MLNFLTSLSFLYALTIAILLIYGFFYYREFARSGYQRKRFPYVFLIISAACFCFLWFNIHASLRLGSFSNLDHHSIRHDGFRVAGQIELGRSDTVNYANHSFNRFELKMRENRVSVNSPYSEEPLYAGSHGRYKLLSKVYPASGHSISFRADSMNARLRVADNSEIELTVNNHSVFRVAKTVRKGVSAWNLFKEDLSFINYGGYTNEKLVNALKHIMLLRDEIPEGDAGELNYFLSGRVFRSVTQMAYDQKILRPADLFFNAVIADGSSVGWGLSFPGSSKNNYRVEHLGKDSFSLFNQYPVSYPLTEEKVHNDLAKSTLKKEGKHSVNKFLLSDPRAMLRMPAVFGEGFLFPAFSGDTTIDFVPVLLTYQKAAGNEPLELRARFMNGSGNGIIYSDNKLILPAVSSNFAWVFSVNNSFNWDFGSRIMPARTWQWLLFGTLVFFFIMVFASSWLRPANRLSWIWQLLSCITIVLLTTRFFLYWRYKSFPPYEGLDLPSLQQLQSIWNFGIIIIAALLLSFVFGFNLLKYLYRVTGRMAARLFNRPFNYSHEETDVLVNEKLNNVIQSNPVVKRFGAKLVFFLSWTLILAAGAGLAAFMDFDQGISRHLAIGLMLAYFIFVFISYKHSPLVCSAETSWWALGTGRILDIVVSNPVKVLLSVSLLGVFVFIDIGFAIVFLNFLLFNEAFLCINYAVAGLSAGSKRNAGLFGILGSFYLLAFIINLLYVPVILNFLLELPQVIYLAGYVLVAVIIAYNLTRLFAGYSSRKKWITGSAAAVLLFMTAFFFFPKERILEKAEITKYRIDVMSMPVNEAIEAAYEDGKTWEPVIRAAQNQWFINTFIYEKNNPGVNSTTFNLLPHAPQNKGAKYNAQATDLVASRFFIAEHGKWSVLLYVLLLLIPATLLASFYKLYPDFTNRININYPTITTGFSVLNYLLITALLVILAATGRYIFFGQDLPFGSILSKQSILFPSLLIIASVLLFKNIPLERYPNRKKLIPGGIIFAGLALILFLVKPVFNKNKEFRVTELARDMDNYIQLKLQPIMDHFDSATATRKFSFSQKDKLFTDSIRKLVAAGYLNDGGKFFAKEIEAYTRSGFSRHLDQRKMLYLDLYSGHPQLAVNDNFFRIEPPPHLQQSWTGNVFSDTSVYNIALWNVNDASVTSLRLNSYTNKPDVALTDNLRLSFRSEEGENFYGKLYLVNESAVSFQMNDGEEKMLAAGDSIQLYNPQHITLTRDGQDEQVLTIQPDAFMKNYYVNGNRYYVYPMEERFVWARHFAESISSEYSAAGKLWNNAFVSFDFELMDSLAAKIQFALGSDTAYKKGAEYGISIADGNGRLIAITDFIKEMDRPDPNDKPGFNKVIYGENGFVSQSLLRKQIGNINLLRLNPGPGSTLKPIIFSAIASQLNIDWDVFASDGFTERQHYFGGEKVAEYDFEKNNGKISRVMDYISLSDNYYHSNVLLLGSYSKQSLSDILNRFTTSTPPRKAQKSISEVNKDASAGDVHWPYFTYNGQQYWLNEYKNWPGYVNGKADFGLDSSFVSIGLMNNFGIYTYAAEKSFDKFTSVYDSSLFMDAYRKSGFLLPEYALFDQHGDHIDHRIPYDVFTACFRGHVKGSSQVMVPPVKMLDAYGKLISQSRNYSLTLNPYAEPSLFSPFYVDNTIAYSNYLALMRENLFAGMREALFRGTAARLGSFLKDGAPYYYYAKTGTTGDNELKTKSKLFTIIISSKDIADPDFNFRNNKFYTIYFTSQNGPTKQNEELQAAIIKYIQESPVFKKYLGKGEEIQRVFAER
jgi:hypothetical protein